MPIPKLRNLAEAARVRDALGRGAQKVVLTNGCFDLLHAGHIYFLQHARREGDALFVALNSDASVRALKGPTRPIQPAIERAYALAALECVHTIVLFEQPRLVTEIRALRPDIYVKAGDYSLNSLDRSEREALREVGAEIRFLPFLPDLSTTALLQRIVAANASAPPR
ncbi:adenylyltransferase/cytidyltransferase family protein [Opitutus terrae]|uniref:adenylyltransferase/cytidyltransferase family protein n=1 Tax=Opitutus terrae TaxID=107709 RepID=UPI00192CA838|nr:adenylyltransferase/cytidyltransferase family protein [Opitutus terrae]